MPASFKTYNQVLRDKTTDYLQTINPASPPTPDEIEAEILHAVSLEFEAMNAVMPKTQKKRFFRLG